MLKEELENLLKLQDLDSHIDELEAIKAEIPKKLKSQEDNVKLKQEDVAKVKKELEEAARAKKEIELEMETKSDTIKKLQGQLYSVKTNKEYSAIQQEIAHAKEGISGMEEKIIAKMFDEDNVKINIVKAQEALKIEEKGMSDLKAELDVEINKVEDQLGELKKQKEDITKTITNSRLLKVYNNIREKTHGLGIAEVVNGSCQACYMGVRPQEIIEVRKFERLVSCENCGRLLYCKSEE